MATFLIEIVSPTHVITEENVSYLRCPGVDGSFGVMADHTDGIIALSVGEGLLAWPGASIIVVKLQTVPVVVPKALTSSIRQ